MFAFKKLWFNEESLNAVSEKLINWTRKLLRGNALGKDSDKTLDWVFGNESKESCFCEFKGEFLYIVNLKVDFKFNKTVWWVLSKAKLTADQK